MKSLIKAATLAAFALLAAKAHAEQVQAAWAQITGSGGVTVLDKGRMPLNLSMRFITTQATCPAYQIAATIPGQTGTIHHPNWQMRQNRPATGFDSVTVCQTAMNENWETARLLDSTGNAVKTPGGKDVVLAGAGRRTGKAPRFVAFGDTGCRGQFSSRGTQNCDGQHPDETGFYFAEVARDAMKHQPDFVIHLGDYRYDKEAVRIWDNWNSDFFSRVADGPLMQTPWAFVRGNHETCDRAGLGWYFFFGPEDSSIKCSGSDARLITSWYFEARDSRVTNALAPFRFVFVGTAPSISDPFGAHSNHRPDCTTALKAPGPLDNVALWDKAVCEFDQALRWTRDRSVTGWPIGTWFVMHKPIWGLDTSHSTPRQTDHDVGAALEAAVKLGSAPECGPYDPSNCGLKGVLGAHEHMFTNVVFENTELPQQFVVGHSGVKLDPPPGQFNDLDKVQSCWVKDMNSRGLHKAHRDGIAAQYRGRVGHNATGNEAFGFLLLERSNQEPSGWAGTVFYRDGQSQTLSNGRTVTRPSVDCRRG